MIIKSRREIDRDGRKKRWIELNIDRKKRYSDRLILPSFIYLSLFELA